MARFVFTPGDQGACGYYRIVLPALALSKRGHSAILAQHYDDYANGDVLIFQRQSKLVAMLEILRWKEAGKTIVLDFDDNLFALEPDNPAYYGYTSEVLDRMRVIIEAADLLTVSTKPLADSYARFNKNIVVLPNSIDESALAKQRRTAERVIVGWQGGRTHHEDLRLVRSPLSALARRHAFDLVLSGWAPDGMFRKYEFRSWIPFSSDLSYYRNFDDFSVGICPLRQSLFNDCKSDIKFVEYSALGIPTVASKTVVYSTIKHGVTGFLARNVADWEHCVGRLVDDASLRQRVGAAARDYVASERTIQRNIGRWEEAYKSL